MIYYAQHSSPFGPVQIGYEDEKILSVRRCDAPFPHVPSPVSELAAEQLQEYFCGSRRSFDLPIFPMGTPFQKAVWQALCEIPYGETRTYGQIAAAIGNKNASRAVGMACNRNPLWIVIPCHRVVGYSSLTGYAGGLEMKASLLMLERKYCETK